MSEHTQETNMNSEGLLFERMISDILNSRCDEQTKEKYIAEMKRVVARSKNMLPYLEEIGYKKVEDEKNVVKKIEDFFKDQNIAYE